MIISLKRWLGSLQTLAVDFVAKPPCSLLFQFHDIIHYSLADQHWSSQLPSSLSAAAAAAAAAAITTAATRTTTETTTREAKFYLGILDFHQYIVFLYIPKSGHKKYNFKIFHIKCMIRN